MDRQTLTHAVSAALADDPSTRAVFLTGSFGRGEADDFSDVDLLVIVDEPDLDGLVGRWPDLRTRISPHLFERVRQFGTTTLFNQITADWVRYDVTITTRDSLDGRSQRTLRPIHDPLGLYDALPKSGRLTEPSADVVRDLVPEFYRVLALLPVVLGREDYVVGRQGADLLHAMLIRALIETVEVLDRGGALHLQRLLTPEQYAIAAGVPAISATKESVLDVHRYCADAFALVARDLCARTGVPWPDQWVAAVTAHVAPYFHEAT